MKELIKNNNFFPLFNSILLTEHFSKTVDLYFEATDIFQYNSKQNSVSNYKSTDDVAYRLSASFNQKASLFSVKIYFDRKYDLVFVQFGSLPMLQSIKGFYKILSPTAIVSTF